MSDQFQQHIAALSPEEKRELLARLLREKAAHSQADYPLSYGQRALWYIQQVAPESSAYNIGLSARICSGVDVPALQRAFQQVVNRHAALRTTYQQRGGELVQVVHAYQEAAFEQIDASGWSDEELHQVVIETHHQPFNLADGPVIRWTLFSQSPASHVLLISVHHIAFDAYSLFVLLNDFKPIYDAEAAGQPLPPAPHDRPYTDFVAQQMDEMASAEGERLKAYWLNQLSGELPVLNLPADYPRPPIQTYHGSSHDFIIDVETTRRLKAFASAHGVTPYMLMLAVFQTLLHRYSGQKDVLIGSPYSIRDVLEFGKTAGYFVNPIVLRSNTETDPTFTAFLQQTHDTVLGAIAHQDYPFLLLVEQLQLANDPSRSPIFQVMFNMATTVHLDAISPLFQADVSYPNALRFAPYTIPYEEGQFDLGMDIVETRGTLFCSLRYSTDLFESTTVVRMAGHYRALLDAVLTHPDTPVSWLPMLTEAEHHQLVVEWNDTRRDYPLHLGIHQLFEEQVTRTPDAAAVRFEDEQVTYDQLNRRANQLAHYLRSLGVGPGTLVGIFAERSIEMVAALFAVLKAGGAYVPLDPSLPRERLSWMIEDIEAPVILTQQALLASLPDPHPRLVCFDTDAAAVAQQPDVNPTNLTDGDHLAYVIFTSGSTGKPKGAQITHRGFTNFALALLEQPGMTASDVTLAVTTISFDISTLEIFLPLLVGASVALVTRDVAMDGSQIAQAIEQYGVTIVQATPVTWRLLLDAGWTGCAGLKMLVGGEPLTRDLAAMLLARGGELWDVYGPTETTVWSTVGPVTERDQIISIGRPIANTTTYVLDERFQPVPVGVPGLLWIGGTGVARGYLKRPELTAERFVRDPFSDEPGARLYNTGDLARWLPDGRLECLGRTDHQVKIRGYRIELGEIESILSRHERIGKTVVVAREDTPGDKRLVAYYVAQNGAAPTAPELRDFLKASLPAYMIPSAFVPLERFPTTPSGKIDRRALPAPEASRPGAAPMVIQGVPETEMERLVAGIWQEILQVEGVSIYDNFFDLGGHSLQVMQVVTRLEAQTGVKVDPVMLRIQTLGQLAAACEQQAANPPPAPPSPPPRKFLSAMKRLVGGK